MGEGLLTNQVRSVTTGVPGRSLNSARANHFVIDEPAYAGGPGEALTPAEAFLAGIASCGVLLVESQARRTGAPFKRAEAAIEGVRLEADPANFRSIHLRFDLFGVTREQAEQLVAYYQGR